MRFPSRVLAACLVLAGLSVTFVRIPTAADEPKRTAKYECRWADTPVTLDGKADEAAWQNATVIDSFRLPWLGKVERAAKQATRARLLWDREYLYFFADLDDRDIFADVTDHDGPIYNTDVFELFFRPSKAHAGYYEFEVNAANAVLDAFFPKWDNDAIAKHIQTGDFHVESKVVLTGTRNKPDDADTGWAVEGRIPWSDFLRTGGRPEVGEEWAFALCRCDYDTGGKNVELSTTAAIATPKIGPFFHQTDDYTPIVFVGPKAGQPFGWKREPLTTSTVVGSPDPPTPYKAVRLYPNLSPAYPVCVRAVPGTDQLMYITQPGPYAPTTLWRVKDDPAVKTADAVKLFDTPGQGVAYDLCFHPKFADNGFMYVGWNGDGKGKRKNKFSRVTRYTMATKQPAVVGCHVWAAAGGGRRRTPLRPPPGGRPGW